MVDYMVENGGIVNLLKEKIDVVRGIVYY